MHRGGAGAAGAINMRYDRDIDAVMRRTARRPIPGGRIAPGEALGFGVFLAVASVLVMGLATNLAAAAGLALLDRVLRVRLHRLAEAPHAAEHRDRRRRRRFPAGDRLVAVTGQIDLLPLVLFAIVFFWTPPHFWSLSLWAHDDYRRAGVPMLPVVAGARQTRRQIFAYTLVLMPINLLPWGCT